MSTSTGWVVGLIILVLGGVGVYWAYSASQPHDDAMMQKDAMTNTGDAMQSATSSDAMMHSDTMASSSDSMMQH